MNLLVTPTDTDIFVATLFTWSVNVRFSFRVTPRNLTVETLVRIESRILMPSQTFLLAWDYHVWRFTNIERKSVGLEPVINFYQFPIHSGMNIGNVTVGCKNRCVVRKWTKLILFEDLNMSLIYKRKSTGPNTDPCGTHSVMFDIEELQFLIQTHCFLLLK